MSVRGVHIGLTFLLLAACVVPSHAQRFDAVSRRNPWNGGVNRAGLREDTLSTSYAAVRGIKRDGGMTDHSVSSDSWTAGAVTESIRHLGRLSFAGRFAYDYSGNSAMCGSMFISPGSYPVDIYEFTPGRKTFENYAFTGGLSADLAEEWRGGLHFDFTAADIAKRKDLRHKNTLLDFEAAPSFEWHKGDWRVGGAYIFAKRTESIAAEEVGSTPDSYEAFFDRGLYFGDCSMWDSNLVHLKDTGISAFAVRESAHGASLQLQWRMLYGEAEYRHRSGITGEKGIEWHKFDSDELHGKIVFTSGGSGGSGGSVHAARLYADWEQCRNAENILVRESVGGVTNTEILGRVPIFMSRQLSLRAEYEWMRGGCDVRVQAEWNSDARQSLLSYPTVCEERLTWWRVRAEGLWVVGRKGLLELTAGASVRKGGTDGLTVRTVQSDRQTNYPQRAEEYAAWHDEYMTALRAGAGLALRVNIARGFYAELSADYEHGFHLKAVPQPNRIVSRLSLGCKW